MRAKCYGVSIVRLGLLEKSASLFVPTSLASFDVQIPKILIGHCAVKWRLLVELRK